MGYHVPRMSAREQSLGKLSNNLAVCDSSTFECVLDTEWIEPDFHRVVTQKLCKVHGVTPSPTVFDS